VPGSRGLPHEGHTGTEATSGTEGAAGSCIVIGSSITGTSVTGGTNEGATAGVNASVDSPSSKAGTGMGAPQEVQNSKPFVTIAPQSEQGTLSPIFSGATEAGV